MIKIGDKTIKGSHVTQTVRQYDKEITIEFKKDGILDWGLDIVITYREDMDNESDKEVVSIEVDDKVSVSVASEDYDMREDLSSTIDVVIEKQFPEESQETRNDWSLQVEETIYKALEEADLEI